MEQLSKERCQSIIDSIQEWENINIVKSSGAILKFKQAPFVLWGDKQPQILHELVLKYDVGDYCTEHVDSAWPWVNPNYLAYAVWITPLNDDYDGGELYFDGELIPQPIGVPIKYQKDIPHEVTEVTAGTRYSLVSWVFVHKHSDILKER